MSVTCRQHAQLSKAVPCSVYVSVYVQPFALRWGEKCLCLPYSCTITFPIVKSDDGISNLYVAKKKYLLRSGRGGARARSPPPLYQLRKLCSDSSQLEVR